MQHQTFVVIASCSILSLIIYKMHHSIMHVLHYLYYYASKASFMLCNICVLLTQIFAIPFTINLFAYCISATLKPSLPAY